MRDINRYHRTFLTDQTKPMRESVQRDKIMSAGDIMNLSQDFKDGPHILEEDNARSKFRSTQISIETMKSPTTPFTHQPI